MSDDKNTKKSVPVNPGEVDHPLLQKVSNDEIDLEIDLQRDDEIAADKPPHHPVSYTHLTLPTILLV